MSSKDRRTRVLIISNMYPSKKYPHYGVFVKNTVNELTQNGFSFTEITIKKSSNRLQKLLRYLYFYIKILFYTVFFNYDFVYGHYASHIAIPLLIAKHLRPSLRIVTNVHGNDIVPEDKHDEKFIPYVKKLLDLSDVVVSPSSYFQRILIKKYGISRNKIIIYPSGGINTKIFSAKDKDLAKKQLGLNTQKRYIGCVMRLEKNKGWDTILLVARELQNKLPKDYEFIIVGNGSEKQKFYEKCRQFRIHNVSTIDFLPQTKLSLFYNALDIFILPTRRKSESLGLAGLEAMTCGCIVISSNKYGPSTYVRNEQNGFTVDTTKPKLITKTILHIAELTQEKINDIKLAAKKTATRYTSNQVSKAFAKKLKHEFPNQNTSNRRSLDAIITIMLPMTLILDNINGIIFANFGDHLINFSQLVRILYVLFFCAIIIKSILRDRTLLRKMIPFIIFSCYIVILPIMYYIRHRNTAGLYMDELYAIKLLYPITIIMALTLAIKTNLLSKKSLYKTARIYTITAPLTLIIPFCLHLGYNAYTLGGYKGFYYANNEINIVLIFTLVYALHTSFKTHDFKDFLIVIANIISLLLIGSKTSLLVIIATLILYSILFIKNITNNKKKLIVTLVIILFLIIGIILSHNYLSDIQSRIGYFFNRITEAEGGNLLDFLTSNRSRRIAPNIEANILTNESGILNLLFGIGRFTQSNGRSYLVYLTEMDFFDTMLWYGIFSALFVFLFYIRIIVEAIKNHAPKWALMSFITIFLFSLIAGHVWFSALAGEIFAVNATFLTNKRKTI